MKVGGETTFAGSKSISPKMFICQKGIHSKLMVEEHPYTGDSEKLLQEWDTVRAWTPRSWGHNHHLWLSGPKCVTCILAWESIRQIQMETHSAKHHTSLKDQCHGRKTRLFYIKEADYTATQINMWWVIGSWIFKKLAGHYWTIAEMWIWTFYYIIISSWKDWRQAEQGAREDEMVGWYHWFTGHESEQALEDSEGQGSLACCSPRGRRVGHEWATEQQQIRAVFSERTVSWLWRRMSFLFSHACCSILGRNGIMPITVPQMVQQKEYVYM